MGRLKLRAWTTFEILPLSTWTLCQQKPYIFNGIQTIFEIFASARRCWGGHLGRKWQVRGCFTFAMARWKLCASTTFEILPLSTCTLCQQKPNIFSGIQPIFEIFASARRSWRWTFGWKVSGAQVFYFCNGKVKTLHIDNILNFATFNLYTVRAKILYLQRHSTDFRNLCLSSKILRVGIWAERFRCARVLPLKWEGKNVAPEQYLKFCHFQPGHCARKNPITPKVHNRFSKSLPQLEDVEVGHLGGKFQVRRYFTFSMAMWKPCTSTTFEILPLSNCTLCQQKSYIFQRYSTDFRNLCLSSKMLSVGICVGSFRCAGVLLLQWQGENFAHRKHLKFCHFQPVQCARKKPNIFNGIQPIFEIFASARRCWGWAFGGKFQVPRYFSFAMARLKLWTSTTFEILPLSTCTLCKQKSCISKDIQPIFEIFASVRRCWGWAFGQKVSGAHVFYI